MANPIMIGNPYALFWNGKLTFIPQKLDIIVGTANIIVIDVSVFITPFRLFDIIDATNENSVLNI